MWVVIKLGGVARLGVGCWGFESKYCGVLCTMTTVCRVAVFLSSMLFRVWVSIWKTLRLS